MSSVREVAAVVSPELLSVLHPVVVRLPVFLKLSEAAEGGLAGTDGAGVEHRPPGELQEGQRNQGSCEPPVVRRHLTRSGQTPIIFG